MIYWEFICGVVLFTVRNEAVGWICLLFAAIPPILKLGFKWSALMQAETRKSAPAIDDEGFYY